jgi:DNA polymerase-3 subunit epsilon
MYEKYKDDERALPTTIEEIEALSSYGKRADLIGNLQYNEEGDMVFGFGKHKGVKVADVLTREPGYFGWMMNADFPLYTKEVLRKFRNNMMA